MLLTLKFDPLSAVTIDTIQATTDSECLDHWLNQIILAERIDDIDF